MTQMRTRRLPRRLLAVGLTLAAFAGCATLPPAQPVMDLKQIAGQWEGKVTCGSWVARAKFTVRDDGSWENILDPPGQSGPRYVGTMRISDGELQWKSDTTGATGTYTLHEGEGQRVLVGATKTGNTCTSRLTPVS